jgi:hypothetical protein
MSRVGAKTKEPGLSAADSTCPKCGHRGEDRELAVQLTEDEEDLIVALRREREPTTSLEEVLAKHGYSLGD